MTIAVLAAALLVALVLLALTLVEVRRVRRRTQRLEAELATERERGAGPGRPRTVLTAEKALRTVVDTAVRVRHQGVGGLVMSSLDELSRWAMEDRSEIVRLAAADGSVTILFSDIEGIDLDERRARRRGLGAAAHRARHDGCGPTSRDAVGTS